MGCETFRYTWKRTSCRKVFPEGGKKRWYVRGGGRKGKTGRSFSKQKTCLLVAVPVQKKEIAEDDSQKGDSTNKRSFQNKKKIPSDERLAPGQRKKHLLLGSRPLVNRVETFTSSWEFQDSKCGKRKKERGNILPWSGIEGKKLHLYFRSQVGTTRIMGSFQLVWRKGKDEIHEKKRHG